MNLISENKELNLRYYKGIDFNVIKNHPKDGSGGMIIVFVKNWRNEISKWKRNNNISRVLDEEVLEYDLDNIDIDNSYISIYQTGDVKVKSVYETIKNNLENKNKWLPTFPVKGLIS